MVNNSQNLKLPISFDNVTYFDNTYLGDLIITQGVIYYFPHANVEKERQNKRDRVGIVTRHFGLLGLLINLSIMGFWRLVEGGGVSVNRSRLKTNGVWKDVDDNKKTQMQLDSYIAEVKKEPIDIGEYGLTKPMRFAKADVKNIKVGSTLKFDTEFDNHDFKIGVFKKKMLKDALWFGGFLQ